MRVCSKILVALAVMTVSASAAYAQENYADWPVLKNPFPSTGGGGVMIDGYNPVIQAGKCATNFTAIMPDAKKYENVVEFDAVEAQGGILCTNGKWRAADGSSSGTTPFRMFIKDGVVKRAP
ncbi:MAG: hypothetical protein H7X92_09315 [Chitinophagales bacterium]|nr:hypothetical protein [Hyphomicrobiales bacterium]